MILLHVVLLLLFVRVLRVARVNVAIGGVSILTAGWLHTVGHILTVKRTLLAAWLARQLIVYK